MLCTVATLPGGAAREIRAWDCVATRCVDRRATDAPDAAPLTGRLQELGAQHGAPILPGALTLALASRAPPHIFILLLFLQKQNLAFAVYLFGSVLSLPD